MYLRYIMTDLQIPRLINTVSIACVPLVLSLKIILVGKEVTSRDTDQYQFLSDHLWLMVCFLKNEILTDTVYPQKN